MVLQGLNKFMGRWAEVVPVVLWSLRTSPNQSTGFTPFFMVDGAEAVLPTDLDYDALRVQVHDEGRLEESLQDTLD